MTRLRREELQELVEAWSGRRLKYPENIALQDAKLLIEVFHHIEEQIEGG